MLELELELEGISEDLDNVLDFCYRESGFGFESEARFWLRKMKSVVPQAFA